MTRRKHLETIAQRDEAALRFATALAKALHELSMTHQQLAEALGITRHTIDYWTRVENPKLPSEPNLIKLRDFLDQQRSGLGHHLASIARGALSTSIPTSSTSTSSVGNLRMAATSFIGREREVDEILSAMKHTHLITLLGPGGIGKTRLALRLATESVLTFADGVRVVELADISNPELVIQVLARALSVNGEPHTPLFNVVAHSIGTKHMLIVLDNCEHLIIACAELLRDLFDRCPQLHVLATSREPVAIDHELVWRVPALALPDESSAPDRLLKYEATRLFIERAMIATHGLTLAANQTAAITQVCRRLDGLPLAIELAAACVNDLSIDQIAARLDRRFQLLTKGSPAALPRHQTLRATIDWSFDLLSQAERNLFRRLAVFAGGWTLAAVQSISLDHQTQPTLLRLVDKSLVVAEERSGVTRYRLLDTIREYARERLIDRGEIDQIRTRHLNYFLEWAKAAEPGLHGQDQAAALHQFDDEIDNLRAALDWSLKSDQIETGAQVANIVEFYWYTRGYWREGLNWLLQLIDRLRELPPSQIFAVTLSRAGGLITRLGEYDHARRLHTDCYSISEQLHDQIGMSRALSNLAMIAEEQGDLTEARSLYGRSIDIQRIIDDRRGLAIALNNLGIIAKKQGQYDEARKYYEDSLVLKQQLGEQTSIIHTLNNLGILARLQSDGATARQYFGQTIELTRQLGNKRLYASSLGNLGMLEIQEKNFAQARQYLQEVSTIFQEVGDQNNLAMTLHNLGDVALAEGDVQMARTQQLESLQLYLAIQQKSGLLLTVESFAAIFSAGQDFDRAVKILAFTDRQREVLGMPPTPIELAQRERCLAQAREQLSANTFDVNWSEGMALTTEQVLALI